MRWFCLGLGLMLSLPTLAVGEDEVAAQQHKLEQLSSQIQQRQAQLSKAQADKDQLLSELRRNDKAVSDATVAVKAQQRRLAKTEAELTALGKQRSQLEADKQRQQEQLASQLRTAWMSGEQDHTALLLGSEDPASLERLMVYYQYLNQARMDALEGLQATVEELELVIFNQEKTRQAQQDSLEQLSYEKDRLARSKASQQRLLNKLDKRLSQDTSALALLQEDREVLESAISQALEALARSQRLDGLADDKGRLPWPTQGRLHKGYGSHRQGQLKWNGWLFSTPDGREVKAVSTGQVVFADWLRGYGLVVVVDHGEQYLSLYGHAQALLTQVGDQVHRGDVIALTGNSGGLKNPGLYFEIRHRGRAVDPKQYLK